MCLNTIKLTLGEKKKLAPEGSWTCISFVCMLSRKQALYTGHRKKLKSDGASNWTLNSTGSHQDNTIMSQANAHFKTLLVYYVTYYVVLPVWQKSTKSTHTQIYTTHIHNHQTETFEELVPLILPLSHYIGHAGTVDHFIRSINTSSKKNTCKKRKREKLCFFSPWKTKQKLQQDYIKTTGHRNGESIDNPEIPQEGDIQHLTLPFGKGKLQIMDTTPGAHSIIKLVTWLQ